MGGLSGCAEPSALKIDPGADDQTVLVLVEALDADLAVGNRVLSLTAHRLIPTPQGDLITQAHQLSETRVFALYYQQSLEQLGLQEGMIPVAASTDRRRIPPPPRTAFEADTEEGTFRGWRPQDPETLWRDIFWAIPDPCWTQESLTSLTLQSAGSVVAVAPTAQGALLAIVTDSSTMTPYLVQSTEQARRLQWQITDFGPLTALAQFRDGTTWAGDNEGRVAQLEVVGDALQGTGVRVTDRKIVDLDGLDAQEHYVVDLQDGLFGKSSDGYAPMQPDRDRVSDVAQVVFIKPGVAAAGGDSGVVVQWVDGEPKWLMENQVVNPINAIGFVEHLGLIISQFPGGTATMAKKQGTQWVDLPFRPTDSPNDPNLTGRAYAVHVAAPNILIASHLSILQLAPSVLSASGRVLDSAPCARAIAPKVGVGPIRQIVPFEDSFAVAAREDAILRFVKFDRAP